MRRKCILIRTVEQKKPKRGLLHWYVDLAALLSFAIDKKVPALGPAGWEVSRDEGKVRSIEKAAGRGLPPGA